MPLQHILDIASCKYYPVKESALRETTVFGSKCKDFSLPDSFSSLWRGCQIQRPIVSFIKIRQNHMSTCYLGLPKQTNHLTFFPPKKIMGPMAKNHAFHIRPPEILVFWQDYFVVQREERKLLVVVEAVCRFGRQCAHSVLFTQLSIMISLLHSSSDCCVVNLAEKGGSGKEWI